MPEKTSRLLIAEMHTCTRVGLYQILTDTGFSIVAETASLDSLDELLQNHQLHVLLLACNLLPSNPLRFLTELRQQHPQTHIVLYLSVNCDDLSLRELANAGVRGMVLKEEPVQALVGIVQSVAAGRIDFSSVVMSKLLQEPQPDTGPTITLDEQERRLLKLICEEKTNVEMAEALHMSRKTVERRLSALYTKLNVQTRVGAAVWFAQHKAEEDESDKR